MILKVLNDKSPLLRKVCLESSPTNHSKFALSMLTTMKAHNAVGLAANQVGKLLRIITLNTPEFQGVMFNPEIVSKSEEIFNFTEGCLSQKKKFVDTGKRAKTIEVKWQDKSGSYNTKEFSDLTSVVIQHEIDHLNGILMSDYENNEK